jgi:hypothetical protein
MWIIAVMVYMVGWAVFGGLAGRRSQEKHPPRKRGAYHDDAVAAVILLGAIWPAYLIILGIGTGIDVLLREGGPRVARKERKAAAAQALKKKQAVAESVRRREIEEIEDRIKAARTQIRMEERQRMRDWERAFSDLQVTARWNEGVEGG